MQVIPRDHAQLKWHRLGGHGTIAVNPTIRKLNSYQGGMCISPRTSLPPACIESGPIEAGRCGLPAEQM